MNPSIERALKRYTNAVFEKAFQGTIPRFESEEAEAAWEAIDVELERSKAALFRAIEHYAKG